MCFAPRGSAVDGATGGGAGRRGLHPAGVVESQTEYGVVSRILDLAGETRHQCLPIALYFSRAVDLSPAESLAKLSNKR